MVFRDIVNKSATLAYAQKAREMGDQGRRIISLGLGEPDFETPEHIKNAAFAALREGYTRYSNPGGLSELRELLAVRFRDENNIPAHPEEIIITPGAKNALFLSCAAVLRPGDEVINLNPCYVSNCPIIALAEPGAVIHNVPLTRRWRLDLEAMERVVTARTKLLMANFPNNPTGTMLDQDGFEQLCKFVERHALILISDEVYEKVVIGAKPHRSPASFAGIRDQVITVNGFSKAYSMTGWRLGYLHAPRRFVQKILKIHQQINTNTATFIQRAGLAALLGPQTHLDLFLDRLRERRQLYVEFLHRCSGVSGSEIDGGFFGFVDISGLGIDGEKFCTLLLERTGVALTPGIQFGSGYDSHFRVSLAAETCLLKEGFQLIENFIKSLTH